MVRPEIVDLDEVNMVVVEKRLALHGSSSVRPWPDKFLTYHQVLQELDVLSSMIDSSACVLLPLTWSLGKYC